MKVLDYVQKEDRPDHPDRDFFLLDPDVVYPIALDELEKLVKKEIDTPSYLVRAVTDARRLPVTAFELARKSFSDKFTKEERAARAGALEGARLAFTALLREQNGGPIGVHIIKGAKTDWKL